MPGVDSAAARPALDLARPGRRTTARRASSRDVRRELREAVRRRRRVDSRRRPDALMTEAPALARRDHHGRPDRSRRATPRSLRRLGHEPVVGDHAAPARAGRAADAVRGGARRRRSARSSTSSSPPPSTRSPACCARTRSTSAICTGFPVADPAGGDRQCRRSGSSTGIRRCCRGTAARSRSPGRFETARREIGHHLPPDGRRVRHRQRARADGDPARPTTTPRRRSSRGSVRRAAELLPVVFDAPRRAATEAIRRRAASTRACSRTTTGRSIRRSTAAEVHRQVRAWSFIPPVARSSARSSSAAASASG